MLVFVFGTQTARPIVFVRSIASFLVSLDVTMFAAGDEAWCMVILQDRCGNLGVASQWSEPDNSRSCPMPAGVAL